MDDISFGEKLGETWKKLGVAFHLVKGMLPGGEFQLKSTKIHGPHSEFEVKSFKTVPNALGDHFRKFLEANGDTEWLIYQGERHTFRQAKEQMDALSVGLADAFGVGCGSVISIAMRNCTEFMLAFLAIQALGGVAVPLNSLWGTSELEYALKDSGTAVLIGDVHRLRLCTSCVSGLGIPTVLCRAGLAEAQELGCTLWEDILQRGKGKPPYSLKDVHPEDSSMIMYTSGSTGFPKGVLHSQQALNNYLKVGMLSLKMMPDTNPACLMAVPLFHITALGAIFLLSIPRKEKIVLMYKWNAKEALDLIEQESVTRFTGVPTMVRDMLEHPTFSTERVKTLKTMAAGGAPTPASQVSQMRQKAKKMSSFQGYGLTETLTMGTTIMGVEYLQHPTSCGRPMPMLVDIVIKDPETGRVLPQGGRGEICIKSIFNMKGYMNKPEDTAKVIDADGYFRTGDVGELQGGYLYIKDRLKDIIIRGGENIDCSEVEAALYSYPGGSVRECSVFGIPEERLGEVVGAVLCLQGDQLPTTAQLSAHAKSVLAAYKVPLPQHMFIQSDPLPKGATGKIDKKGLREFHKNAASGPPASKL